MSFSSKSAGGGGSSAPSDGENYQGGGFEEESFGLSVLDIDVDTNHFERESHFDNYDSLEIINDTTISVASFHFNQHKHIFCKQGTTGGKFLEMVFGAFFKNDETSRHLDCLFSILDYGGWEHKQDLFDLFVFVNNFSLTPTYLKNNPIFIVRFSNDPIKYRMRMKEIIKDYSNGNISTLNTPAKLAISASSSSSFLTPPLTPISSSSNNNNNNNNNYNNVTASTITSSSIGDSNTNSDCNAATVEGSLQESHKTQLNLVSEMKSFTTPMKKIEVSAKLGSFATTPNTGFGGNSSRKTPFEPGQNFSLNARLQKLRADYNGIRAIAGDGNCYFRAVLYSHLEFIVSASIIMPETYSRSSIMFLADFFEQMKDLMDDKVEHTRMVAILKDAAAYNRWTKMAEIQCDFLNKAFDAAFIKAGRMMLSIIYLMYKDVKINDISLESVVTAVYDDTTVIEYCEKCIEKMDVEAEGSWVDFGLLPSILNARCTIVYFDPSDRETNVDLTVKKSNFELKFSTPSRSDVKKFMETFWNKPKDYALSGEQAARLKKKYECMKWFLRAVDPDNKDNKSKSISKSVFSFMSASSSFFSAPCFYNESPTEIYLLFRPGHYDTIYPKDELSSLEPRYFFSPSSIKYKKKVISTTKDKG